MKRFFTSTLVMVVAIISMAQTPQKQNSSQSGGVNIVNGAIQAAFSVSDTKKVYFSKGNLQYHTETKIWRFAENQWDTIGMGNPRAYIDGGWIDLFGWGTSGFNGKDPSLISFEDSDYYSGSNDIAGTNYDWGVYNAISNGGNQAGIWRTLSMDEIYYLLALRSSASSKCKRGIVNGIRGIILLPDDWTWPSNIDYPITNYSIEDWSKMEANGAVFLPAAGDRLGPIPFQEKIGSQGFYWSSTAANDNAAVALSFDCTNKGMGRPIEGKRLFGLSVRLVKDVK